MIVIVGHGPSLTNRGLGEYIDSFEYVIRFPYLGDWQKVRDYGVKTSYFCGTVTRIKNRLRRVLPECGYFIWSKRGAEIGRELSFLISKFGGRNVSRLVRYWSSKLPKSAANPYLSSGTTAVCIAAARIGQPIVILGCDSLRAGNSNTCDYMGSAYHEKRALIEPVSHSFKEERELINLVEEKYNTDIYWGF